ncbi:MAG: ABC transporter ATP-binding protein [Lachnospiraceae bacterium]|nr:ABC transporter ATP-binding protein [Lachnospiraceae bacterium]
MTDNIVISINNVSKMYKLYDNPLDRLKEALRISRKVKYREYFALNNISFDVCKGETVGLIGTNGAGKSTLLKIVTGVLSPTAGSVSVTGKIAALLELGAGFNMEYSGIENIYLNGTMMGYTKSQMDEKVEDIVDFAGIGEFINQPVKTYSSGMFARLAFAVAINVEPDILIVDEALSVGDIYFQSKCFKKMDEIKKNGTTILLVTHDLSSIVKYCDRAVLINKGEFVSDGKPKKIVDIYKKILVNQFDGIEGGESGFDDGADDTNSADNDLLEETSGDSDVLWKSQMVIGGEETVYGNNKAKIIDFGLFDDKGRITNIVMKKSVFTLKIKVRFNEPVSMPIFAYTFKNEHGVEITGTNSMFEKIDVPEASQGDVYIVEFRQRMNLQGGDYLLSFGCTGYENDDFVVYDRLYDIAGISVVSEQNTVGYFDMNTSISVKKEGNNNGEHS